MGGRNKLILLVVVAAAACFVLFKYVLVSEEERIKRTLYAGKEAIEEESLGELMPHVSRYYRDEYGFNYLAVRRLFTWLFQEFDDIAIHVTKMDIEITEKGKASAHLLTWATATGTGREETGYIVGSSKQPCKVTIALEKSGGNWKVIETRGVEPGEMLM